MRRLMLGFVALILVAAFAPAAAAGRLTTTVKVTITAAQIPAAGTADLQLGFYTGTTWVVLIDNDPATSTPQVLDHRMTMTLDVSAAASSFFYLDDLACNYTYMDYATSPDHWTLVAGKGQSDIYYFADGGVACADKYVDVAPSAATSYQGMVTFVAR
jgi:hypothetical protein